MCLVVWDRILDSNPTALLSLGISVLRWSCQSKYSFKMTLRYFTVLDNFIFSPLMRKLRFLVIAFPFGLNNANYVLLAFKFILFARSHCTSRARLWFISLFSLFRNLFMKSKFVSSAKWCTLLVFTDVWRSFINNIKSNDPKTEPCGTPWVISWVVES